MSKFSNLKKKYVIKVPKDIKVLYCDKDSVLTFISHSQKRSIRLLVKVVLLQESLIIVTNLPVFNVSRMSVKSTKELQGTSAAKIRQTIIEVGHTLYYKLNFVGVGYRVFPYEGFDNQLYFKLGYSHLIYFKVPDNLSTRCQKFTKLFLIGNGSFVSLTQTASQIRQCKIPEPYKGKGILYAHERIILKKGKKI